MSKVKQQLSRKEAALHLAACGYPVAPKTLAALATKQKGPPYVRFMHRIVLYDRLELEAWAKSQTRKGGGPSRCG